MINLPVVEGRSCDGCTKCCEGYLEGEVRGQEVSLNKPCFFAEINKGCKDYENRPDNPCIKFQCEWLVNPDVPIYFKPSFSNAIIENKNINNIDYIQITEAGSQLDSKILSWAINYSFEKEKNIVWSIDDEIYTIGDEKFEELLSYFYPDHE